MSFTVVLAVAIVFAVYVVSIYNGLVSKKNRFHNAFSQIDIQLERRYDLIQNLVETAKAYMAHERETLEAVVASRNRAHAACNVARNQLDNSAAISQLANAEGSLTQSLGRFMAVAEAYPDLKAAETMKSLMEELTNTENTVAFARQAYNDSVMEYNTACETFPANLISAPFGFRQGAFLKIDCEEKKAAPKVQFR